MIIQKLILENYVLPYTQYNLHGMKTNLYYILYFLLKSIHFSSSVTISFKSRTFSLYLNSKLHAKIKFSRFFFFFHLTTVEIIHQSNINQTDANDLDLDILSLLVFAYNVDYSEVMC